MHRSICESEWTVQRAGTRLPLPDVKKIAVLRANALGDFIFVLPALAALRLTFPDAELVYLGNAWHTKFLAGRPGPVDRAIAIPDDDLTNDDTEFFAAMHAERFDLAFQMHGGGRHSNPFVRRLGARRSIGLQDTDAPPLDINVPYRRYQHEVLRYLEVVRAAGCAIGDIEPRIAVTQADRDALRACLPRLRQPFAVLHPGASDPRRRWPPEKFARIGDLLHERGMTVCVSGTQIERDVVAAVTARMRRPAIDLCGALSMPALTALLARARLVVSNDTGPLHLARAVGTPTVGIYWIGNVITGGPLSITGNRYCIAWETRCPSCGKDGIKENVHRPSNGCSHETSFVGSVEVRDVEAQIQSLLATPSAKTKTRTNTAGAFIDVASSGDACSLSPPGKGLG